MKKIGYFRVTMGEKETYIKYDEFYDMSPQTKEYYKRARFITERDE